MKFERDFEEVIFGFGIGLGIGVVVILSVILVTCGDSCRCLGGETIWPLEGGELDSILRAKGWILRYVLEEVACRVGV